MPPPQPPLQGAKPRPLLQRWRTLTTPQAITLSLLFAGLIRLWCLAGVPFTITNDGAYYLRWAWEIVEGTPIDWPVVRTPGYSLFIGAFFAIFGIGPLIILIGQHLLGCLIAALISAMASRYANPRLGLILGIIVALDPVLLGLECYALNEALCAAILILSGSIILLARRRGWLMALFLGLSLGFLCLVRPAFQITLPFLGLAWICIPRRTWRWRFTSAAVIAIGFLIATGPWLLHNVKLGIRGLSTGNAVMFWLGVNQAGLLTSDFPLPDQLRSEYDRLVRPDPRNDQNNLTFINTQRAWSRPEVREPLARWAMHGIRAHPMAYTRAVAVAFGWQLEIFPKGARIAHDDTKWLLWRLGQDGRDHGNTHANYNVTGAPPRMDTFDMPASRGPFRNYFRWWGRRSWLAIPRVILFASALAVTLIAIRRRDWPLCLTLLATFAYTAAHAILLLCQSRYSMPCWTLWWIAPAVIIGALIQYRNGRLVRSVPSEYAKN